MSCTAKYENCTGIPTNDERLKYCQACIDMEVEYYKKERIKHLIAVEEAEKQLARLGAPIHKPAMTIWPSKRCTCPFGSGVAHTDPNCPWRRT